MKILYYFLAAICGLFGLLALARTVEVLAVGGGLQVIQVLIAIVALALAWMFLGRTRAK